MAPCCRPWFRAKSPASQTARLEKARPTKDRIQNGATSFQKCDLPLLPQTQRRLSTDEGTVATTLATMLAGTSDITWNTPKREAG